ncbi:MAG: glutathione synthase [Deltaproteobacteria bacterium]|nr:glutathione synthase [Deltaproteobacteria bacterium]NND27122.1 glutathione synthase [Myxococcales bacterium]MBT8466713.1 glutathione synthase [Deltaproteobacteria bacterium]MBT8483724.1 glutathione synthase [Deltaproteobacteria bacterium]NNK08826.1 glutathione synthase [Myxococcales bacterium]
MHIVFVMDPVSTVIVDEDTSFALMLEAQARGHRVDHCLASDVGLRGRRVVARVRQATMRIDPDEPIRLAEPEDIDLVDVDAVFIRKDPPFTDAYLWLTLVLDHLEGDTLVVNDPRGLREANEKLYAHHFPEIVPATIMTSHKDEIIRFLREIGGKAVIKPIDGHGGEGVFLLSDGDSNLNGLIESVTHLGSRNAIVQALIPEVYDEGDKRILLVDGELLGVVGRVPSKGDLRSNVHVGGSAAPAELSDADRKIIETIAPRLVADRLFFVGLDVIGGKLIEVNVTSPTLLQQMSRLAGENFSAVVIDRLEDKARLYAS